MKIGAETLALREAHARDVALADLETDPYPILRMLREDAPLAWIPSLEMWLATRWDDVMTLTQRPELFTAETEPSFLNEAIGVTMLTQEGPEARRLKSAFKPPLTVSGRAGTFFDTEFLSIADELIDDLQAHGGGDLVERFATPLATRSLQRILGLEGVSWEKMWELCGGICLGIANFEKDPEKQKISDRANRELEDILTDRIAAARAAPDGSAISTYATEARDHVSDREIVNNVRLMISGGINEPRDGLAAAVYAFLALDRGAAQEGYGPAFWRRFAREVLRFFGPVGTAARMTTQPCELAGVRLPAGEFIAGCLSSANRDERAFAHGDVFDPDREEAQTLAFAHGQHLCLGMYAGNQEIVLGCARLIERLPDLQLAPGFEPVFRGFEFRGLQRLDVVC